VPDDVLAGDLRIFRSTHVWLVAGTRDEFATPERLADTASTMRRAGVNVSQLSFEGGHRLDDATLERLTTAAAALGHGAAPASAAGLPEGP
jgi:predicted esterase